VAELVEAIESEANAELARTGRVPLGVAAILRQTPETRPSWRKKSPAPMYHAATKAMRKAFWEAYGTFVAAFREAADRWRECEISDRLVSARSPLRESRGRQPSLIGGGGARPSAGDVDALSLPRRARRRCAWRAPPACDPEKFVYRAR
jgi:hypothetical protein